VPGKEKMPTKKCLQKVQTDSPIGTVDLVLVYMLLQALSQAGVRVLKVQKTEST
jgi:hypothetical protein